MIGCLFAGFWLQLQRPRCFCCGWPLPGRTSAWWWGRTPWKSWRRRCPRAPPPSLARQWPRRRRPGRTGLGQTCAGHALGCPPPTSRAPHHSPSRFVKTHQSTLWLQSTLKSSTHHRVHEKRLGFFVLFWPHHQRKSRAEFITLEKNFYFFVVIENFKAHNVGSCELHVKIKSCL